MVGFESREGSRERMSDGIRSRWRMSTCELPQGMGTRETRRLRSVWGGESASYHEDKVYILEESCSELTAIKDLAQFQLAARNQAMRMVIHQDLLAIMLIQAESFRARQTKIRAGRTRACSRRRFCHSLKSRRLHATLLMVICGDSMCFLLARRLPGANEAASYLRKRCWVWGRDL